MDKEQFIEYLCNRLINTKYKFVRVTCDELALTPHSRRNKQIYGLFAKKRIWINTPYMYVVVCVQQHTVTGIFFASNSVKILEMLYVLEEHTSTVMFEERNIHFKDRELLEAVKENFHKIAEVAINNG